MRNLERHVHLPRSRFHRRAADRIQPAQEGDGRTWLQGFGGDLQNVAIAAVRQGTAAGYITSLGQDWMGDAFLEPLEVRRPRCIAREPPSDRADRRQLRHPRPGRSQVRLSAQEFRGLPDDARDLAGRLHRRRPLLPPVGHRPGDQRQRAPDLRRRRFGRARRRREGLLRHQPPAAALGPRHWHGRPSTPRWRAAMSCCRASTIPSSSPA